MSAVITSSPSRSYPPPPFNAWDEYLAMLGLTRKDQDALDQPGTRLAQFIDERACAAALNVEGASTYHTEDAIQNFWYSILEAEELEDWNVTQRNVIMPEVPGLTKAMVLEWARACESEHEQEMSREAQRVRIATDARLLTLRQMQEGQRLAPILEEDDEYDPE